MNSRLLFGPLSAATLATGLMLAGCGGNDERGAVTVLRGSAETVDASGTAIGFEGRRVAGPRLRVVDEDGGWLVAGASWWDGRSWHDQGTPTCLPPGSARRPVEMGVLEAEPHDGAPGRGVVVWLKCLDRP